MQIEEQARKLLLIDDDPISLEVLHLLLGASGFLVTTAADLTEALEILAKDSQRFDLILTDVQMPGIHCEELIAALKAKSNAPLFAMSGSQPESAALVGSSGFLLKPFEAASLVALLDNLPSPQNSTHPPVPSLRVLHQDKLLRAMPRSSALQVYRAFLEDLPLRLAHMEEMVQAASLESSALAAAKEAHILRGSSAMIGAEELAEACAALEEAGSRSATGVINRGDLVIMLGEIRDRARKLQGMLNEELAGPTGNQE